ncbi:helix-turn-helix transcriptional regulator [Cellulosilyticum sp. ST5]|uniref:helix-turn-helix domain-containing protein n=1 Tax=Cellulosilyticum sp. ST5 TaxID=3055805 RepID=UPI0039772FDD
MRTKEFTRLIVKARKERRLSQQEACELLGISDASTLSKFENGIKIPGEDIVVRMVAVYDEPFIGYMYLKECTKIGEMLLPNVLLAELDNLALNFQNEFEDVSAIRREILAMARDNLIDEDEKPQWEDVIQKEISELLSVLIPLRIRNFSTKKQKPSQGGNLVRACY